jgi:hypothetical protein
MVHKAIRHIDKAYGNSELDISRLYGDRQYFFAAQMAKLKKKDRDAVECANKIVTQSHLE